MSTRPSIYKNANADLLAAVRSSSVWMALGWNDVQARYNRSKLGVFWASLSVLIFVGALGPIYSTLFGVGAREFMLHFMLGLIVWNFLQTIVMESGREYVNASNYLISFQLSYSTLLLRVVWRNFVVFCYQFLVFLLFAVVLKLTPTIEWLIFPIAVIVIALNALWMGILMSIFATRFRDLSELMNNLFRLAFFVTPIMWTPGSQRDLTGVANMNPFYHVIEIFRGPLHKGVIDGTHWIVALSMMAVGWLIAYAMFARYRSRIAFWI